MVSEFMLQQTPVSRVLPVYEQWLARWPRPADLAAEAPGEAVRAWGRLGYPRRALRLHGAAGRHNGTARRRRAAPTTPSCWRCPASASTRPRPSPRSRTGSGTPCWTPTCAGSSPGPSPACSTRRTPPPPPSAEARPRAAARGRARRPRAGRRPRWSSARWSAPRRTTTCAALPDRRAVRLAARGQARARRPAAPRPDVRRHRPPGARQAARRAARGARARAAGGLDAVWHEPVQRARALDGLVADGLVEPLPRRSYRLPADADTRS